MPGKTSIGWASDTWNPVTGCSRVSDGCDHCYAEELSLRYGWSTKPWLPKNAADNVVLHPERLGVPGKWRKPRRVFVNSMADLFHPRVPGEFINQVWMEMYNNPRHIFMVLTKRPKRLRDWTRQKAAVSGWPVNEVWPDWMWVGTSIESRDYVERADLLREVPAAIRFISAEPLLGPIADELFPLLGCNNPVNGGNKGERVSRLRGSRAWGAEDQPGWDGLAPSGAPRNQGQAGSIEALSLFSASSREQNPKGVLAGASDVSRGSGIRAGAPTGMDPSGGADPCRIDDQSRERNQGRQSSLESSAGDPFRAGSTCGTGSWGGTNSTSVRRGQSRVQTDVRPGVGDTQETRDRRATRVDRSRFRSDVPDGVEDCARRPAFAWMIVGGESGPSHRPMEIAWVRDLYDACRAAGTAFFAKQDAHRYPGQRGRIPDDLWVQEYPQRTLEPQGTLL